MVLTSVLLIIAAVLAALAFAVIINQILTYFADKRLRKELTKLYGRLPDGIYVECANMAGKVSKVLYYWNNRLNDSTNVARHASYPASCLKRYFSRYILARLYSPKDQRDILHCSKALIQIDGFKLLHIYSTDRMPWIILSIYIH